MKVFYVFAFLLAFGVAVLALLFAAADDPARQPAPATETTERLSKEQQFLYAVWPHLSSNREHDTLGVLSSGVDGVCGAWLDPVASRTSAIELLMRAEGYSLTEATAIHEAAVEHLCPP